MIVLYFKIIFVTKWKITLNKDFKSIILALFFQCASFIARTFDSSIYG